jgi:lysozyme
MRVSARVDKAGLAFIAGFEGLRLKAYKDIGGVWTIGYGHTGGVRPGHVITRERAMRLLKTDVSGAEAAVHKYVDVGLNQHRYNALVSFVYNCGAGAFRSSTLLRRLNAGDYGQVPSQLLRWNKVNGQAIAGLTRRRKAEGDLWRLKG